MKNGNGGERMEGIVRAVCVSDRKGVAKRPVEQAHLIRDYGIEQDAHAGKWHRQISLLSQEKVDAFNQSGAGVKDGDFGENLLVSGIDFANLPVGTRFRIHGPEGSVSQPEDTHRDGSRDGREDVPGKRNEDQTRGKTADAREPVLLELTQIGKACHTECAIKKRVGVCIMPTNGVFAKVVSGGYVRPGDVVEVLDPDPARPYTAAVITLSDRAYQGVYEDRSGPEAAEILSGKGYDVVETVLLPDDPERLKTELKRLADQRQVSLVITSGGTGFSERDRTPEATSEVADRNAPGIAEAIRVKSLQITDHAMLSRGVSVIRGKTLIVNLPGSVKAVRESLGFILGALDHGLGILRGTADN